MKIVIYFLTLFFCLSFKTMDKGINKDKQDFMIKVFSSFVTNNCDLFISYTHSKSSIKTYYNQTRKTDTLNPEQKKALDQFLSTAHDNYIEEQKVDFNKIQNKAKELSIIWSNTIVDSIAFKENKSVELTKLSGTIFFRNKNNSNFFKMNFEGLVSINDTLHIDKVFVPFVYIGPKNRLATANLKKNYIDNCTKKAQEFIDYFPNKSISKAMFNDCAKCYCEDLYFQKTEEADGIQRIKEQKLPFNLPPNYKPKK